MRPHRQWATILNHILKATDVDFGTGHGVLARDTGRKLLS